MQEQVNVMDLSELRESFNYKVSELTPQTFYRKSMSIKYYQKVLQEEQNKLEAAFVRKFDTDLEYPVTTEDGKSKYIRIFEPEGRFVYNTRFEIGLRQTAKNKAPGVE